MQVCVYRHLNSYAGPSIDQKMADRSGAGIAAMVIAVAACCPPPVQRPPAIAIVPATCTTSRADRVAIAQPAASRFERPAARQPAKMPAPKPVVAPAIRTQPPAAPPAGPTHEPPVVPPAGPKQEIDLSQREPPAPPPAPPAPTDTLPDAVVLQLLESGRAVFVRCFKQAVARDPLTVSFKVRVHVVLDGNGAITSAHADTPDPSLGACLERGVRWLHFPASGRPVAVDLPLFYRAE